MFGSVIVHAEHLGALSVMEMTTSPGVRYEVARHLIVTSARLVSGVFFEG